jgi:hypothetical protein
VARDPKKQPNQLRDHNFTVAGDEPLSKRPASVRLYESDDEILRPLGTDMAVFIRQAVREKLQRRYSRFTDPPGFNDGNVAPVINGLKPGDEGYMEAWAEKNQVSYTCE